MTKITHFAWLSIAAAVSTIGLKSLAFFLTGSVGLLSDALESVINLVAAVIALIALTIATRPADDSFAFGYTKAEYFSSGIEGALIFLAAIGIAWASIDRFLHPQPLAQISVGLLICLLASLINFGVAQLLFQAGKKYHSITLEADAQHLMTDVWTSGGVIIGVMAVKLSGWQRLDPIVALLVAVNILWSGFHLIRRSTAGLMDKALSNPQQQAIQQVLTQYSQRGDIQFHALRTRQAGARHYVSFHVLVPGRWTVQQGHELLERIEADLRKVVPRINVLTHLEPQEDPVSLADIELDR